MKFSSNLVELMKALEGISPEDVRGYLRFLLDIYKRYQIATKHFITKSFRKLLIAKVKKNKTIRDFPKSLFFVNAKYEMLIQKP